MIMAKSGKLSDTPVSRRDFLAMAAVGTALGTTGRSEKFVMGDTAPWPPKNDPSAGTWLPVGGSESASFLDDFLQSIHGHMRILACWYEGNQLRASRVFSGGRLTAGHSVWACAAQKSPVNNHPDALDLKLTFKLTEGVANSAGVAVAFDFTPWTTDNYVLVPALLYGGNRFRILPHSYPPYIYNPKERPLDMPVTTTDILHLNPDGSHAKVEMNAGNVATPMLSFFDPKEKRGFILLAEQCTRFGNNGLFVEEDAGPRTARKQISFVVSAPGVREQRYVMCGRAPSWDHGTDWKVGDELTLKFKLYNFPADNLPAFYAKAFEVRKALTGKNTHDCITPYSAALGLILKHHNADKWFEGSEYSNYFAWTGYKPSKGDKWFRGREYDYYCNRPGDPGPTSHQIGWGSIPITSFPELIAGTPERLERVCLTMDAVMATQSQSGLMYAINRDGTIFGDAFRKETQWPMIAMTRRTMDVLYFGLQTLDVLKKRGHAGMIKPAWENGLRACADGLVNVWRKYGQFGQFIDADTLKMNINGSTAGCAAGAGLALASRYFRDLKYLTLAKAAVRMYYTRDFLRGYAGGGAADILQSPDSEAPWDMLESCVVLYEVTGSREWVEKARYAADMLSTWMVSYDYAFPEGSAMQRAGTHAVGSIFASSQNNHGAPGFYILSGDSLLKLFRATGEERYAEMYKDTAHNVIQYVGAPYNPLRHENGHVTERVQLSDWEGNNMGSVNYPDSNMAWETLAALTCLENPGIYLHTDDDTFLVLDHVEAKVVKRDSTGVTFAVINPTRYPAHVKIFAESAARAKQPLDYAAYLGWPHIELAAGARGVWRVDATGRPMPTRERSGL